MLPPRLRADTRRVKQKTRVPVDGPAASEFGPVV